MFKLAVCVFMSDREVVHKRVRYFVVTDAKREYNTQYRLSERACFQGLYYKTDNDAEESMPAGLDVAKFLRSVNAIAGMAFQWGHI